MPFVILLPALSVCVSVCLFVVRFVSLWIYFMCHLFISLTVFHGFLIKFKLSHLLNITACLIFCSPFDVVCFFLKPSIFTIPQACSLIISWLLLPIVINWGIPYSHLTNSMTIHLHCQPITYGLWFYRCSLSASVCSWCHYGHQPHRLISLSRSHQLSLASLSGHHGEIDLAATQYQYPSVIKSICSV